MTRLRPSRTALALRGARPLAGLVGPGAVGGAATGGLGPVGPAAGRRGRAWLVAMALVVLALAQPRWGRIPGRTPPAGHDVVLLVDVSRSMAAEDAVPDRLGVAIEAAGRACSGRSASEPGQPGGGGRLRRPGRGPLPLDREPRRGGRGPPDAPAGRGPARRDRPRRGARGGGRRLRRRGARRGADDRRLLRRRGPCRYLVLRSTGSEPSRDRRPCGRDRRSGPGPSRPPARSDDLEAGGRSTRDPTIGRAMEALAKATGGAFIPLGLASADLGALFRDRIEPTARRRRDELRLPERVERFPAFSLTAIWWGWPDRGRAWPVAGVVRLAFLALTLGDIRSARGRLRTAAESGRARAVRPMKRAGSPRPSRPSIGPSPSTRRPPSPDTTPPRALFQLRRYSEAIARYEQARERGDPGLAIKIDYAQGNTNLALGDIPGPWPNTTRAWLELARAVYDAIRRDAAENRAFAARRQNPPPPTGGSEGAKSLQGLLEQPRPSPGDNRKPRPKARPHRRRLPSPRKERE